MGESGDFSLLDFEACFKQHKDNDDGLVTKHEMITFIKKVVGLNDEEWINNFLTIKVQAQSSFLSLSRIFLMSLGVHLTMSGANAATETYSFLTLK